MNERLRYTIESSPVINTHCHHLPGPQQKDTSLDTLLRWSYNSWCMIPWDDTPASRHELCRQLQGNTYFYWFEKALQELCGLSSPLDEHSWDDYDRRVRELSADDGFHWRVMRETCRYRHVLWDPYWAPNTKNEYPGFYTPVYRVDMFLFGYSLKAHDHDGNHPLHACGWEKMPDTYDGYLALIEKEIAAAVSRGCVALKIAAAYDRSLDFRDVSPERAGRLWNKDAATPEEIRDFQDGTFHYICRLAEKYRLPVQCHTGLGALEGSRAMELLHTIRAHPRVPFVLFHGSYPWMQDVLALLHCCPNVYADLCWLPLISTSACRRFLREYIEVCSMDRITWGCDTWNSFDSLGALRAAQKAVGGVLDECIIEGLLSENAACAYAEHIFYRNAESIYRLRS